MSFPLESKAEIDTVTLLIAVLLTFRTVPCTLHPEGSLTSSEDSTMSDELGTGSVDTDGTDGTEIPPPQEEKTNASVANPPIMKGTEAKLTVFMTCFPS